MRAVPVPVGPAIEVKLDIRKGAVASAVLVDTPVPKLVEVAAPVVLVDG